MHRSIPLLAAAVLAAPGPALAQTSSHQPPHIVKIGTTARATVPGKVIVQVLVPATGAAVVKRIVKSTNHADDAAALDVARSSTYAHAMLDGKPNTEFFDFTANFTGNGISSAPSGSLVSYEALLHRSRFAEAKTGLTTYLAAHPADPKAQLDLALANSFLGNTDEAAASFAKVPAIPDSMKPAARRAFYEASTSALKGKQFDVATSFARKAVAVTPDYTSYAALGAALLGANDDPGAVSAYEKSRSLAMSAPAAERATIDGNLVVAYLGAGAPDKAKTTADEAKTLDPKANAAGAFGQFYAEQAKQKTTAGDLPGAAAAYEMGAQTDPADAVTLYGDAAFAYLKIQPADNAKAKAAADKALALDATDALANFAEAVSLSNGGKGAEALPYLNKADASAKAKGQTDLATQIETSIHNLNATK